MTAKTRQINKQQYNVEQLVDYTKMNIPELYQAAADDPQRRDLYMRHAGEIQRNLDWRDSPLPPFLCEPPLRWQHSGEYDEDWRPYDGIGRPGWSGDYMDDHEARMEAEAVSRLTNHPAQRDDCRRYTRYTNHGTAAIYQVEGDPQFYVFATQSGGMGYYLVNATPSYEDARAIAINHEVEGAS